jgi:hypothetical protein
LYPFWAELEELVIILDNVGALIGVEAMTHEQRYDFFEHPSYFIIIELP